MSKKLSENINVAPLTFPLLATNKTQFLQSASLEGLKAHINQMISLSAQEKLAQLFDLLVFFTDQEVYKEGKFIGDDREHFLFEQCIEIIKDNPEYSTQTIEKYLTKINKRYPRVVMLKELALLNQFPTASHQFLSELSGDHFLTFKNNWICAVMKLKVLTAIRAAKPLEFPKTQNQLLTYLITKGIDKKISFDIKELVGYFLASSTSPKDVIPETTTALALLLLSTQNDNLQRKLIECLCAEPFNYDWINQFFGNTDLFEKLYSTSNETLIRRIIEEQSKYTRSAISNVLSFVERSAHNYETGEIRKTNGGAFLCRTMLKILLDCPEYFNSELIEKFQRLISLYRSAFDAVSAEIDKPYYAKNLDFAQNTTVENYKQIEALLFGQEPNFAYKYKVLKAISYNAFISVPKDRDSLNAALFYLYYTKNNKGINIQFLLELLRVSADKNASATLTPNAIIEVLVRNHIHEPFYQSCLKMLNVIDPTHQWKKDERSLFTAIEWRDLRFVKEILSAKGNASAEVMDAALLLVINHLLKITTAPYPTPTSIPGQKTYLKLLAFLCTNPNLPSSRGLDAVLYYLLEDKDALIDLFSLEEAERWKIAASLCERSRLVKPSRSTLTWVLDKATDYNQWSLVKSICLIEGDLQKADPAYFRLEGNTVIKKVCHKAAEEKQWHIVQTIIQEAIDLDAEILEDALDTAITEEKWDIVLDILRAAFTYPLSDYLLEDLLEIAQDAKRWDLILLIYINAPSLQAQILEEFAQEAWKPLIELVKQCETVNEWEALETIFDRFHPTLDQSSLETIIVSLISSEQHAFLEKICTLYSEETVSINAITQFKKAKAALSNTITEKDNTTSYPVSMDEENLGTACDSHPLGEDSLTEPLAGLENDAIQESPHQISNPPQEAQTLAVKLNTLKALQKELTKDIPITDLPNLESFINPMQYLQATNYPEPYEITELPTAPSSQTSTLNSNSNTVQVVKKTQHFLAQHHQGIVNPISHELSVDIDNALLKPLNHHCVSKEPSVIEAVPSHDVQNLQRLHVGNVINNIHKKNKPKLSKQQVKYLKRHGGFFDEKQIVNTPSPNTASSIKTEEHFDCRFTFEDRSIGLGTKDQLGQFSYMVNNRPTPFTVYYLTKDNAHNIDRDDVECFKGKIDAATEEGFVGHKGSTGIKIIDDSGKMPIVSLKILGKQQSGASTAGDFRLLGVMDEECGVIVFLRATNHDNFNRDVNRLKSSIKYPSGKTLEDEEEYPKVTTAANKF